MGITGYNVLLVLHILSAMSLFSGIALAGAVFESARRRQAPAEVALLLGLSRIGVALVGIGGLGLPVFGLWLVHAGHWGYGTAWVDAGIGLFVVGMGLGGSGGKTPKQARLLAQSLAESGQSVVTPELRALLDDPRSRAANYLSGLVFVAIVAVMVCK